MVCGCHYQSGAKRALQAVPEVSDEFNIAIGDDDLRAGPIVQEEVPVED